MYRWGLTGFVIAPVIGLFYSLLLNDFTVGLFLIEIIGNSGIVLAYLLLKMVGREKIIENSYWSLLYVYTGFLGIVLLKSLINLFYGANFISAVLVISSNLMLSIIIISMFFTLLRKQKTIIIDMNKLYEESENEIDNES